MIIIIISFDCDYISFHLGFQLLTAVSLFQKVYPYAELKRCNNTKLPGDVDRERLEVSL